MAKDKKQLLMKIQTLVKARQNENSAGRRLQRKNSKNFFKMTVGIAIAAVLVVIIIAAAGKSIYLAAIRTTSNSNLSAVLTSDGKNRRR